MTKEEYVGELARAIRKAIHEAAQLLASNTPMGFGDHHPAEWEAVGDEMDKAREHMANALWKLRAIQ